MERVCDTPNCYRTPQPSRKKCETCRSRIRRELYPVKDTYYNLRSNAKRRGIEFSITLQEWEQFCIDTNYIELRGVHGDDLTVDRKKVWLGYTISNMQVLTKKANTKKQQQDIIDKYKRTPLKYAKPPDSPF